MLVAKGVAGVDREVIAALILADSGNWRTGIQENYSEVAMTNRFQSTGPA